MPLDAGYLLGLERAEIVQTYDWRDAAIYALGLGYGDPLDPRHLRFLDRDRDMRAHPAMANVLASDTGLLRDPATGIDYARVVHGEQRMRLHAPLPLEGRVRAATRVVEVVDKGAGQGALVTAARQIRDAATGSLLASVRHTAFCRGAGGFGGARAQSDPLEALPERTPDGGTTITTPRSLALVYRLSGDLNPLHSDPDVARRAGFERPILHGLATFGIACRALMSGLACDDPARVAGMAGRFSAPVLPGDTICVEWWTDGPAGAAFRARVGDRIVLTNGRFDIRPAPV